MKAVFSRKVVINRYELFVELELAEERKDIQEFLKTMLELEAGTPGKVRQHLVDIEILDEQYSLTKSGNHLLKTAEFFIREMGVYEITTLTKDALVGGQILSMERMRPHRNGENGQLNNLPMENPGQLNFREQSTFLVYREKKREQPCVELRKIRVRNFGQNKQVKGYAKGEQSLQLVWQWNEDGEQELRFQGKLKAKTEISNVSNLPLQGNYSGGFQGLISELLSLEANTGLQWNNEWGRMRIPFYRAENDQVKNTFQGDFLVKTERFSFGEFDHAKLSDVPVMPSTDLDAEQWRDWLLEQEVRKGFITPKAFEVKQRQLHDLEALRSFPLTLRSAETFLEEKFSPQARSPEFWNLAATVDLDPFGQKVAQKMAFHLAPQERISIQELMNTLTVDKKIRRLIYIDRYMDRLEPQQNFAALTEKIRHEQGGSVILITLKGQEHENHLENLGPKVTTADFSKLGNLDHDRYWVFIGEDGESWIWTCTRSLDFLELEKGETGAGAKGSVRKSAVTFTRVAKDMRIFSNPLRVFIKNLIGKL